GLGSAGDFPGALFIAVPPVEMEWPQRKALAEACGGDGPVTYAGLQQAAASRSFDAWHDLFIFGTVADRIAERFGTKGSPISLSTACSSGATAIQLGVEAIRRGEMQAALCIGTDGSVNPESLIRFSLLSALSTQNDPPETASKPFSKNRDGFVMGEGAAALVLEDAASAVARGAKILGYVLGCGEKGDGFHRTRSSPDGAPIIAAIRASLDDAGIGPEAIDTVNAHGTSTPENDRMEAMGLMAVFGEGAARIPVTSNKSMLGHTLTAAGAIEAVISLLTIRHGRIPPTINYTVPDPAIPLDIVTAARDVPVFRVLSNSFGFGGQNTCLVLGSEPA
ncbi:beta-ketoacyl-ACP synthase, partial [Methylobacterium sp. WL122]